MDAPEATVAAARRALEARYGLACEGVADDQIAAAIRAAAQGAAPVPGDPGFLERIVDRLPIDESWLFREDALWSWLRDDAGPAILEGALAAGRPIRVLSVGCSCGQEAFSAAIVLQELLERIGIPPSAAAGYAHVVGIDPSPARVDSARSGVVGAWSVQRSRPDWLRGRVTPEDEAATRWRVDPCVRAMCRFDVGNLLEVAEGGNAALGGYDLVLCRHVLIYFRAAEAERIAEQLAAALDRGALLVFSAAEAHLLDRLGLDPLAHLGAARASPRDAARPPARARARARPRRARGKTWRPSTSPEPGPARSAADTIAAHIRVSLEHAQAGRTGDALREARAALFHDPQHLYSRLLLGQHLIEVDAVRGREVLRELLDTASRLPADAAVPCAEGLCVGQLAAAAKVILETRSDE